MTGSDSKGAGHVSQAELATFKKDMANEVGAGTVGSPVAGATPPTSGAASQPVAGVADAYAGQPGLPYP